MKVIDAIAEILRREGVASLCCYPTTPMIEAMAKLDIPPVICRQERVGVGIADGFARVRNGRPPGVFAMQSGPGVENAVPGIATAYSDSSPVLLLPLGYPRERDGVRPAFSAVRGLASITKSAEQINVPGRTVDAMRRAFAALRTGRPSPVLVEIPEDVAEAELEPGLLERYRPVPATRSGGDPADVEAAAAAILDAARPLILAGAGVLYAEAHEELAELAELLRLPVMTTMAGKSAISEKRHPFALGSASGVMSGPVHHFLGEADLVLAVGTSLTHHDLVTPIPADKQVIHVTNAPDDLHKTRHLALPILGDAKLVLRQLIECCRDSASTFAKSREDLGAEIARVRVTWLGEWMARLTSDEVPINPYRVIWELMSAINPGTAIVTHDSGNPRYEMMPFYAADGPRSYLGWGKSHQLGTGLALALGAKLAAPEKFCAVVMGDAAFGMTGIDFETAVRASLPICAIVLKNSAMAVETPNMPVAHEKYGARGVGGDYADIARALGGWAERVEDPSEVAPAIHRAKAATEDGRPALVEFITSEELALSHRDAFK